MKQEPRRGYFWIAIIVGIGAVIAAIAAAAYNTNRTTVPSESQSPPSNQSKNTQANTVELLAPDSKPYGKSYSEWAEVWWTWAQKQPTPTNPMFDSTGERCSMDQTDRNVWFLAGTTGGLQERKCTVPSSKAVIWPFINTECSHAEDKSLDSYEKRKQCATSGSEGAVLHGSLDGVEMKDLDKYWFVSEKDFFVDLPPDNVWGAQPGNTPEVSAGNWGMIGPLSPGEHELRFGGSKTDVVSGNTFATDVIYHLTVIEK